MFNQFRVWRKTLSPGKQLLLSFVLHWLYWFPAWLFLYYLVFGGPPEWKRALFYASGISIIQTLLVNGKTVRSLLKRRKNDAVQPM